MLHRDLTPPDWKCPCVVCDIPYGDCDGSPCCCYTCEALRVQEANEAVESLFEALSVLDAIFYMDDLYEVVSDLLEKSAYHAFASHHTFDPTTRRWEEN